MVNARGLKVAAVVVGGAILLLLASFVLRMVARILTWAVLVLLALGAGYVLYQLYTGWSAAGRDANAPEDVNASVEDADESAGEATDVETVQERYTRGEITEAELEAELEDAVSTGADVERERERE